ncbi:MAG: GTP-binding protein [Candidatus Omnitrophica bacterium]|nr:GTP-binding protein [Candidatus Omnitrophota bacterium]
MIKIVFLGELDCGKSTLIGRLLYDTDSIPQEVKEEFLKISQQYGRELEFAYLLDSFEEERRGEFTLDTTQVFINYKDKEYLLIDVPGHKELIKNMLTGTSYANYALLVSDVEKPLEEQTKRHIYLLKFLGIKNFIIVINKMDKLGFNELSFNKAVREIGSFLTEMDLNPLEIIPVSAKEGENVVSISSKMDWYKGMTLIEAMGNLTTEIDEDKDLRFLVQDIYYRGKEEIVLGRIVSGKLRVRDKIRIVPEGWESRVRKIVVFGKNKKEAKAKESIGLILDKKGLKRGNIIYKKIPPNIASEFRVKIFCLLPFRENDEFRIKINVQESNCYIIKINEVIETDSFKKRFSTAVRATDVAEIFLKTDKPLVIENFYKTEELGRFILYKNGEIFTVGIIPE